MSQFQSEIQATDTPVAALESLLKSLSHSNLFIITDSNVEREVLPMFADFIAEREVKVITIPAGEEHKNLSTLTDIWQQLSENGATRHSIIINIGGGVVSDIGGFAASTFKRGIRYINIPTTVLAAVDASCGGKTGIDFNGLKNEIGAYWPPEVVIMSSIFYKTLPEVQVLSGFAEIVKMAMISSRGIYSEVLSGRISPHGPTILADMRRCADEKLRIADIDPYEVGLRKVLNFGHTCGHAFESMLLKRGQGVTHGEAVAHGILVALILSHMILELPCTEIHNYRKLILRKYFQKLPVTAADADELIRLMGRDKKNTKSGEFNFVLISEPGGPRFDIVVTEEQIRTALTIYLEMQN